MCGTVTGQQPLVKTVTPHGNRTTKEKRHWHTGIRRYAAELSVEWARVTPMHVQEGTYRWSVHTAGTGAKQPTRARLGLGCCVSSLNWLVEVLEAAEVIKTRHVKCVLEEAET